MLDELKQESLTQSGRYMIRNGWVLTVRDSEGYYKIDKDGIYGIWATRFTGGENDDGIWYIHLLETVCGGKLSLPVVGEYTIETCQLVIDIMEALIVRYEINDYSSAYTPKKQRTLRQRIQDILLSIRKFNKVQRSTVK